MAEKQQTILRTQNLQAFYVLEMQGAQKIVKAVNEVNLQVYENEIYGIAGESGCGKTTLLKTLFNEIAPPLRLIEGKLYYRINDAEVDVTGMSADEKRRLRMEYISYIPQGSMSVFNPVQRIRGTFQDFIGSHVSGKNREQVFELAHRRVLELGLPRNVLDTYPHQLSGGMRQRVTIALASVLNPRIMIGDEPTTALDVVVQRGVIQMLKEIQRSLKNTIIMVTHDMGVHANIADRIGIMYAGKIVEEGTTEQIFANPSHPYTQFLINSLPKFGDKSMRDSVPGSPPSLADVPKGCPFHPRCPHARDICRQQMPDLTRLNDDHKVACWLVGGQDG
ncbi:MAG: ABC transporter ATP-binding protein [Anaerolineae bacterium]|nr:ABC transporter ATP-binding protein [Anaerolineae bacterium]NUQ03369.1 ABC transporter ATP-binding protein [Anaerolineae bacterium]